MNLDDLTKRFPNASRSFLAKNLPPQGAGSASVVEHSAGIVALAANQVKESHRPRFLVCITSVRNRLLDEDNLCQKYHVDLCRYAGALPSDTPGSCKIQTIQRKAAKGEKEHTEITIDEVTQEKTI